jgi:hypothetical protein
MNTSKLEENKANGLPPNAGLGRPKGAPNKSTAAVREAIARMAEDNAQNFAEWLTKVAADSPEKACDIYLKAIEYHIPKLARTEVTGAENGPLTIKVVTGI